MKKKNLLFVPMAALLLLSGCNYNDKNFDGLDELSEPKDVKKIEYTLTAADYATIASNKTNIALAEKNGVKNELTALKTTMTFNSVITATDYLPAFIAAKWYTASDQSVVKITCNESGAVSEEVAALSKGTLYTLTASDYKKVWGKADINFFAPSKPAADYVPAILNAQFPDAEKNAYVYASYNVSEREPADVTIAFKEDFETGTTDIPNWSNVTVEGTFQWLTKSFSGNKYAQQTGYKHTGNLDSYLISKAIEVEKDMQLSFDALYANYVEAGGRLQVLISTNFGEATKEGIEAATWDDVTSKFAIPTSTTSSGNMEKVGPLDLKNYVGKEIRIAFHYTGDGDTKTSTIRIDNVTISTPGKNEYSIVNTLYTFNGKAWTLYTGTGVTVLSQADFVRMGLKYDNFSSSAKPDTYLPTYLTLTYPYAQKDNLASVAYKYYDGTNTTIRVDQYKYDGSIWAKVSDVVTNQFRRVSGEWKYSPDVTINLTVGKSQPTVSAYYQAIADYVWEEIDQKQLGITELGKGYRTNFASPTGSEYYFATTAYQNNFDFRPGKGREQYAAGFEGMKDEEIVALWMSRVPEAFIPALEKLHSDADLLPSGAELDYIINFGIYDGSATPMYTITYKVVGKGKFEYIPDSFKQI